MEAAHTRAMRRVLTKRSILKRKQTKYSWTVLIVGAAFYCFIKVSWQENQDWDEIVFWGAVMKMANLQRCGVAANWTRVWKAPTCPDMASLAVFTPPLCAHRVENQVFHFCIILQTVWIHCFITFLEDLTIPDLFFYCLCLNSTSHLLPVLNLECAHVCNKK